MSDSDWRYELRQGTPGTDDLPLLDLLVRGKAALRRNIVLFALVLSAFVALAVTYKLIESPVYQARSVLMLDPTIGSSSGSDRPASLVFADALIVDSEVEVLRSRDIVDRAYERLLSGENEAVRAFGERFDGPRAATKFLEGQIDIERVEQTYLIEVNFTDTSPDFAAAFVDALTDEYIATRLADRRSEQDSIKEWLQFQLARVSEQVLQEEAAVEDFKIAEKLPTEGVVERLQRELERALIDLEEAEDLSDRAGAAIDELDSALLWLRLEDEQRDGVDPLAQPTSEVRRNSPALWTEWTRLRDALADADLLSSDALAALQSRRDLVRIELAQDVAELLRSRRDQHAQTKNSVNALREQSATLRTELSDIARKQTVLNGIERRAEAARAEHTALLEQLQDGQRDVDVAVSGVRLVEEATVPARPSNLPFALVVAAAAIGGGLLAVTAVFVAEQLDNTVRTSEDAVNATQLPFVGLLPELTKAEIKRVPPLDGVTEKLSEAAKSELKSASYAAAYPYSGFAETFRRIIKVRANDARAKKWVAFVSAVGDEGKTHTAANFAFFVASAYKKRVLIVDADTRHRSMSTLLEPIRRELGEEKWSNESASISKLGDRIYFLRVNDDSPAESSSDILNFAEPSTKKLGVDFDYIVVDTPPLAFSADTLTILERVKCGIMVLRWGSTSVPMLTKTLQGGRSLTDKIHGVCLTRVDRNIHAYYEGKAESSHGYYDAKTTAEVRI